MINFMNLISWTGWTKDDWKEFLLMIPYTILKIAFLPIRLFFKGLEKAYDFVYGR